MKLKIQTSLLRPRIEKEPIYLEKDFNDILDFSKTIADYLTKIDTSSFVDVFNDVTGELILSITVTVKKNGTLFVSNEWNDPNLPEPVEIPEKYLQYVDPKYNNNKYYRLYKSDMPNKFIAEYGRNGVGADGNFGTRTTEYPLYMYYIKFEEKVNKGYQDNSNLIDNTFKSANMVQEKEVKKFKEIKDSVIKRIVDFLQKSSSQVVKEHYNVEPVLVSQSMIDKADEIINQLRLIDNVNDFNRKLIELYMILPRKMARVADCLIKEKDEIGEKVSREENLLDTMKTQVIMKHQEEVLDPDNTLLDVMGIELENGSEEDIKIVKQNLSEDLSKKVKTVLKVKNKVTNNRFNKYLEEHGNLEKKLLWHGSVNENWLSILATGLSLNPNAKITGKMFGYGIYFAPKAIKSWGYTSAHGSYWARGNSNTCFMGLFETVYGNPYMVYQYGGYSGLNQESFNKHYSKYNCLHASSETGMLRNDEIIFYNEEQVNIKYLVEFEL